MRAVVTDPASIDRLLAALRRARDPSPSPPDLATVLRATRRAVAAPCPALPNRPPSSSDSGISVTSCSDRRHRAALLRAIPHHVGLLSTLAYALKPRAAAVVDMYGAEKPTRRYREVEIIKAQQSSPWSLDKDFDMLDKLREDAGRRGCDGLIVLGQANTNMALGTAIHTLKGYLATCIQ